jgi:phage baseplate assembly protein W
MSERSLERPFLGRGWSFPVALETAGAHSRFAEAAEEEKVRQAIWLVLGTARGERVMRPDFGCGIHELVFSPNDPATVARVADSVRDALLRWEPRVDLLDVVVRSAPGDQATLLIGIEYRVRSTNNVFNVVYPFYLERSSVR